MPSTEIVMATTHTCQEANPWVSPLSCSILNAPPASFSFAIFPPSKFTGPFILQWKVRLDNEHDYIISRVSVYNRNDCCMHTLPNAEIQILDEFENIVETKVLPNAAQNEYHVDFDMVAGRYVKVYKPSHGELEIAEVIALGWSITKSPSTSPTASPTISRVPSTLPTLSHSPSETPLPNVALGKTATQHTTYQNAGSNHANMAVDGNDDTSTHTDCGNNKPWWQVDLDGTHTISSIRIANRQDCCDGRLKDFHIYLLNEVGIVVDEIFHEGTFFPDNTWSIGECMILYFAMFVRGETRLLTIALFTFQQLMLMQGTSRFRFLVPTVCLLVRSRFLGHRALHLSS